MDMEELYDEIDCGDKDVSDLTDSEKKGLIDYIITELSFDGMNSDDISLLRQLGYNNELDLYFLEEYGCEYSDALEQLPYVLAGTDATFALSDFSAGDIVEYFSYFKDKDTEYVDAIRGLLSDMEFNPELKDSSEDDELLVSIYLDCPKCRQFFVEYYDKNTIIELYTSRYGGVSNYFEEEDIDISIAILDKLGFKDDNDNLEYYVVQIYEKCPNLRDFIKDKLGEDFSNLLSCISPDEDIYYNELESGECYFLEENDNDL